MTSQRRQLWLLGFCALAASGADAREPETWADALGTEITAEWESAEYRAFDFWIGEWEMNWRPPVAGQLKHQAEGSWTRQRVFPILGGKALVELAWARDNPEQPSQRGFSIRYYDPDRQRWVMAQNWPNASNTGAAFVDQLIGDEHHGRLTMYSTVRRPNADGDIKTEHRRYNFSDIRPGTGFRWDGSNTADLGATWYTWYVVDAYRLRDLDPFRPAGSAFPGVHGESLCETEPHGAFDALQGVWTGTVVDAAGDESHATFAAGVLIDGCGVAGVLDAESVKSFITFGYMDRYEHWLSYSLDSRKAARHQYMIAAHGGEVTTFTEAPDLTIKDEFAPFAGPEFLETSAALARRTWEMRGDDKLVIRDERRASADDPWMLELTYRLERR